MHNKTVRMLFAFLKAGGAFLAFSLGSHFVGATDYDSVVTNTPNLLGYWRFDPVFQTNSLVNGYQGALQNTAQIGPPGSGYPLPSDPTNQALILDGTSGYLTTTLTGQITNEGTVTVWVNLAAEPSDLGHFFQITGQSQSGNDFDFQIQTDNGIYFFTDNGSATVYFAGLPTNQWHFLAATFVANTSRAIYVDGSLVASSVPGSHSVNSHPLSIGENLVFSGRHFAGKMSDVAVFNRALTAAEIAKIFQAGSNLLLHGQRTANALVLSWPTNYGGYILQTNSALDKPSGWGALASSYGTLGTNYVFTNPTGSGSLFYRLMK